MNVAISLKSVVHIAGRTGYTPACGAGNRTSYFSDTDRAVSCKRCLKILADQEEHAARTAYYAGLSDAQDMDLSQADDRADDVKEEGPACTCPADERAKSGTDNHYIECPQAPASQPQREADPRTGLPVVTVDGTRWTVGFVQHHDMGYPDFVDFWLTNNSTGPCHVLRAYANSAPGSLARSVWDAQSALQERNR